MLSSLLGATRGYIEGLMPAGYLHDYSVDSELPMLRRRRHFRPFSSSQLATRRLPLLSVRMEPTADVSDFATGVSWHTGNRFLLQPDRLARLIHDDNHLRYAGYQSDRIVVRFAVSLVVETDLKAREVLMYLRRAMPTNYKVFLNDVVIYTEIPTDILRQVWADMGLGDGSDPTDSDRFQEYLSAVTAGDVRRTINSASGRTAFSFGYFCNPILVIDAPSISVNRDGNVVRSAQVDFSMTADLEIPVAYAYQQKRALLPEPVAPDFGIAGSSVYFTNTVVLRAPSVIRDRLGLAYHTALLSGARPAAVGETPAPDVTALGSFLPDDLKEFVTAHALGADPDSVAAILWRGGVEVPDDQWNFDPLTWELTIFPPGLYYNYEYHLGVYCDLTEWKAVKDRRTTRAPTPSPLY
jgi:hypothetical protein